MPRIIPILAYHKITRELELGVTRVLPRTFRRHMEALKAAGFTAITLSRARAAHDGLANWPVKPLVLTFDDGYADFYENAMAVIQDQGFTATVFPISAFIGKENLWDVNLGGLRFRHLNARQLRELDGLGVEIGSHSAHHRSFVGIPRAKVVREMADSKTTLEQLLGTHVRAIAYPYGRCTRRDAEIAQSLGYRVGCTLSSGWLEPAKTKWMLIPRMSVYLPDGPPSILAKVGERGSFAAGLEMLKQEIIRAGSLGSMALDVMNG